MDTEEQTLLLLDRLQDLLEGQIEMALKSKFRQVEELAVEADFLLKKIIGTKEFELAQLSPARENISYLYKRLELILITGKDSLKKQMRQVSEGKKTLQAYSDSN